VIVGGDIDRVAQAVALAKRPHVIVATPGRLADHLRSTKGFNLRSIKFLVRDPDIQELQSLTKHYHLGDG